MEVQRRLFSEETSEHFYFVYIYFFLSGIWRNSKAEPVKEEEQGRVFQTEAAVSSDSWDRWGRLGLIWGSGRRSTWPERTGVTEEESREGPCPMLCIGDTVFILPLNINDILFRYRIFGSHSFFPLIVCRFGHYHFILRVTEMSKVAWCLFHCR